MERNPYIRRKTFRTFFTASVLTSLAEQINRFSDGIILSHLVNPDALGAIALLGPVMAIAFVLGTIVLSGASILVSKMIGSQNFKDASYMMVVCSVSLIMFYAIVGIALAACSDTISEWITKDGNLLPLVKGYFPIAMISLPFLTLNTILCYFIKAAGKPILVTKSVVILSIGNILFDLLFVGKFDMGIGGAAWASIVSLILSSSYLSFYFKRKDCLYHLDFPEIPVFKSMFSQSMGTGLPLGISLLASSVITMCLNALVLNATGSEGLFILSVGSQMLMICMLVLSGTSSAIMTIGGVLLGEKDLDGYRSLVTNILKKSFSTILVFSLAMAFFPDIFARIFGASGEMLERISTPLGEFALILAPTSLMYLLSSTYIILGHKMLSAALGIFQDLSIYLILLMGYHFFPGYFWLSLPIGIWLVLGVFMLCMRIISGKKKDVNWFTLIPEYQNDPSLSLSVRYSKDAVEGMLEEVCRFILTCRLPQETVDKTRHCIEELSYNIIDMTVSTGKNGFFDIRITCSAKELLIVLKDDNRPYNPIYVFNPEEGYTPEERKIGLAMANVLCEDISYAYMNGINCTYLKFAR